MTKISPIYRGPERRRTRNAAEDEQYVAARNAHKTADARRGPHQKAVEAMTGGTPYYLSRAQADAILAALDIPAATLADPSAAKPKAKDVRADNLLIGHMLQVAGDVTAKIVRHRLKWLPADDSVTTIPLTDDEAKYVGGLLPRGQKLTKVEA